MSERRDGRQFSLPRTTALAACFLTLPALIADTAIAQQGARPSPGDKTSEMVSRGQREAVRQIKYGDWQKFCFKTPGTNIVCRTTISGNFETGQSAVRADQIGRASCRERV